jgi:hypothetical protein
LFYKDGEIPNVVGDHSTARVGNTGMQVVLLSHPRAPRAWRTLT